MNAPDKGTIRPEDTTSTPRAKEESTQTLSESSSIGATPPDTQDIREQPAKIEAGNWQRGKFRLREVFLASILVATPLSALFSVLFSWVLSPGGVTIELDLVGYLGLVAIVITLIGATGFFYVALLTVQRNTEARAVRIELDKVIKTLHNFKGSVEPELDQLRSDVNEQHREIQDLKSLLNQEKGST